MGERKDLPCWNMTAWCDQSCFWQAWTSRQLSMRRGRGMLRKLWKAMTNTDGWLRPFCERYAGLEGKTIFECVESSFTFNRCLRQGSIEAPRLWQMMATQLLAAVEGRWTKKRMGVLMEIEGEKASQLCSSVWADNFWIMSQSKRILSKKRECGTCLPNVQVWGGRLLASIKKRSDLSFSHRVGNSQISFFGKIQFLRVCHE